MGPLPFSSSRPPPATLPILRTAPCTVTSGPRHSRLLDAACRVTSEHATSGFCVRCPRVPSGVDRPQTCEHLLANEGIWVCDASDHVEVLPRASVSHPDGGRHLPGTSDGSARPCCAGICDCSRVPVDGRADTARAGKWVAALLAVDDAIAGVGEPLDQDPVIAELGPRQYSTVHRCHAPVREARTRCSEVFVGQEHLAGATFQVKVAEWFPRPARTLTGILCRGLPPLWSIRVTRVVHLGDIHPQSW